MIPPQKKGSKSCGVKDNQGNKKEGKEQKKRLRLMGKTEQTAMLHIKLAPISRCALRRSLPLSLVREDVFLCLLYSCIYEVVGDLRALSITAFYCLNVDRAAPCA